jgi:hypothetical protein
MGNYVTADDIKAEGAPSSATDARINARIVKWEAIVERLTRQVFRVVDPGELTFDGNNSSILHFSLPLIEVTALKINGETTALDTDEYRAFIGREEPQDDRKNPKIKLTPVTDTVWRTRPWMFVKGLDQKITAKWGYVEADDDSTPPAIIEVIKELVVLDLDNYFDKEGQPPSITAKKRERTDGHEIEWMETANNQRAVWTMIPRHLAEILAAYRAPFKIASPEPLLYVRDPGIDVVCF